MATRANRSATGANKTVRSHHKSRDQVPAPDELSNGRHRHFAKRRQDPSKAQFSKRRKETVKRVHNAENSESGKSDLIQLLSTHGLFRKRVNQSEQIGNKKNVKNQENLVKRRLAKKRAAA